MTAIHHMLAGLVTLTASAIGRAGDAPPAIVQTYDITSNTFPDSCVLPAEAFDDFGGDRRLDAMTLQIDGHVELEFSFENDTEETLANAAMLLAGFGLARYEANVAQISFNSLTIPSAPIAPTDGVPGSGRDYWEGTLQATQMSATTITGPPLTAVTNATSVPIDLLLNPLPLPSAGLPSPPTIESLTFDGTVRLTYEYSCTNDCPADIAPVSESGEVGNGIINVDDLLTVIQAFGTSADRPDVSPSNADCSIGNGIVGIDDILVVIISFGSCESP